MRVVLLSLVVVGCSETSHQEHDREQVCRDTAAATCERYVTCGKATTLDDCIADESARCDAIAPQYYCMLTEAYSPDSAELCLEQTRALTCPWATPGVFDTRGACLATCIPGPGDDDGDF